MSRSVNPSGRPSVVIVGAGPRGTGLIERIAANAPELYGDAPLDVHLVDPHPPGGGRIWRADQSPLLWMNSTAEDVTMFTDETVEQDGPVRPGPSLAEWARGVRSGEIPVASGPAGGAAALGPRDFAGRRLQSAYLGWVYERSVAALPPRVAVHEHRRTEVRVSGSRAGRQQVWLAGRPDPLLADLVVLTLGHLEAELGLEQRKLADFAARHGLTHLPPAFTADTDLSALRPGEPVLVRGFGLAFVDLMVLLTEGRGGSYATGADGQLTYRPSGREPVLHVGSRRGVPYHAKSGYELDGERPPLPRFFGPEQVDALLARPGTDLDFRRDIWPLIDKELGFTQGAMVEVRSVHKSFGPLDVLKGVDLDVRTGEVTVVLGPSGSGKSTLLRTINHLEKVDSGSVSVDGALVGYRRDDTAAARRASRKGGGGRRAGKLYELREREILRQRTEIGFVFRDFHLFPHLTVLENITEAPVSALRRPKKDAVEAARTLLARVGLAEKADAYPRQLSGGQQSARCPPHGILRHDAARPLGAAGARAAGGGAEP